MRCLSCGLSILVLLLVAQPCTAYRRTGTEGAIVNQAVEELDAKRAAAKGLTSSEIALRESPFSQKDLNEAYQGSMKKKLVKTMSNEQATKVTGADILEVALDVKLDGFLELMEEMRNWKHNPIDTNKILASFDAADPLFDLGVITPDRWEYAWKHLPSNILDYAHLTLVFHSPTAHFVPADAKTGVFTFAGWKAEGGAYADPADCSPDDCRVHVNMRDLFTDMDEVTSNLLLHIHYMQQHQSKAYWRCHDADDRGTSCRGRDKCWLSSEDMPKACSGKLVKVPAQPTYSIELKGYEDGVEPIVESLRSKWKVWAERLQTKASALTGCGEEDLKVHVIQGATEAIWLMTSKYAMQEQPAGWSPLGVKLLGGLTGSYGGRFEADDRRYARFLLASKANKSMTGALNAMNDGKHVYDPADGPFSVSTEIISLESWKVGEVDPVVTEKMLADSERGRKCAVLLNVGYAFGTSAMPMGLALKDVFGKSLKAFHAVGKAGGLVGEVGDYQVPSEFFLWDDLKGDTKSKFFTADTSKVDTTLWSGGRQPQIHRGSLMTVPSVVLQTHQLLNKAKLATWHCAGLEMESFWFKKALPDTPGLFLYYTSDIPQAADSSLAHESYPWKEGQTLFNGLVRMVFSQMLQDISAETPSRHWMYSLW